MILPALREQVSFTIDNPDRIAPLKSVTDPIHGRRVDIDGAPEFDGGHPPVYCKRMEDRFPHLEPCRHSASFPNGHPGYGHVVETYEDR